MTSPFYNNINVTNNMIALKETTPLVEVLNYDDHDVSWLLEEFEDKVRVSRYRHSEERGLEAEYFIKNTTPDLLMDTLLRNQKVSIDDDLVFALEEEFESFIISLALNS